MIKNVNLDSICRNEREKDFVLRLLIYKEETSANFCILEKYSPIVNGYEYREIENLLTRLIAFDVVYTDKSGKVKSLYPFTGFNKLSYCEMHVYFNEKLYLVLGELIKAVSARIKSEDKKPVRMIDRRG